MSNSKYGRIIAIATTVSIILLGIIFITCTAHLFATGDEQPYTRERVGDYLIFIAIPSFISLVCILAGIIYNALTGYKEKVNTPRTDSELLDSFTKRYALDSFPEETRSLALRERDRRLTLNWLASDFSFLMFIGIILYFKFVTVFTIENLTANLLLAFAGILPLGLCAVAIHIPKAYMIENSCKRELRILKESIKEYGAPPIIQPENKATRVDFTVYVKCAILLAAVVFLVIGILNGGISDVLAKGVKICTECIGLG